MLKDTSFIKTSSESQDLKKISRLVQNLRTIESCRDRDQNFDSPINLNYKFANVIQIPELIWTNHETKPIHLRVTNSGKTIIISGRYKAKEIPAISGGPLTGNYIYSQTHLFWGSKTNLGSVHTIDGCRQALEIHSIYFRDTYITQEKARCKRDGIVIVVYLFEVRFRMNEALEPIVLSLDKIKAPNSSMHITGFDLNQLLKPFTHDYFTYFGLMSSRYYKCQHAVQWIVSRNLVPVSFYQMKKFNPLYSQKLLIVKQKWRRLADDILKPKLFLVNTRDELVVTTWLPVTLKKYTV